MDLASPAVSQTSVYANGLRRLERMKRGNSCGTHPGRRQACWRRPWHSPRPPGHQQLRATLPVPDGRPSACSKETKPSVITRVQAISYRADVGRHGPRTWCHTSSTLRPHFIYWSAGAPQFRATKLCTTTGAWHFRLLGYETCFISPSFALSSRRHNLYDIYLLLCIQY